MSFTYNLATDVGVIRLHLGDHTEGSGVRPNGVNFLDEEITQMRTAEGDDNMRAVAALLEILSTEWANQADYTIGPRKEDLSTVSKRYADLALMYRNRYGVTSSPATASGVFSMGMARDDAYAGESTSKEGTEL